MRLSWLPSQGFTRDGSPAPANEIVIPVDQFDRWDAFQLVKWAVSELVPAMDSTPVPVSVTVSPPL